MRRLRYRPPIAIDPLLRFLGDRAIPGVESFDGTTFRRAVRIPDGAHAVIALTPRLDTGRGDPSARRRTRLPEPSSLIPVARRLLDLDADPAVIDAALSSDPALRPLVRATPGIRVPGAADGFELAVRAILGQQVSVRAARDVRRPDRRGERRRGSNGPSTASRICSRPPSSSPQAPCGSIGLTTARAATLQRLAELVASGELDLSGSADREATTERLLAVPGIGPWTAAYIAMRALRDPDAFPVGDLGVRLGFEALGLPSAPADTLAYAERWRPWRAYAVMHLWTRCALRSCRRAA